MALPSWLSPFFSLQYPVDTPKNTDSFPDSAYYATGLKDIYLAVTLIAIMAVLRDAFRLLVFEPFARWKLYRDAAYKTAQQAKKANGTNGKANSNGHTPHRVTKSQERKIHRSVLRFAEQGWSMVYYPLQWGFGLYVNRNLPTRLFNPVDLWVNYPHVYLPAPVKFYYIAQTAFYLHQMLILNAEARRKDHYQMMTHHVITVFLMGASYFYNLTRVGCLIMILMDWCDIFLPMAKMMRYLELPQILTDAAFGWFLISWFVTRHVLFIIIIWSTIFDIPRVLPFDWDPVRGHFLTKGSWMMFLSCLLSLEVLQIIWFGMIVRIAWRVVTSGEGASDDRSDDEDER
ncbi:longevity assurance proteins LAG1/LAC1 [Dendrothele bispora CBS 962.96]|uniref:Longevity assurance proteins LAG1/LAC1 n=1 Tax=Dendrothele bispora (strain CBS 962.96) TaxID=1314807 RepID=A0A4S8MZI4_DENBC|nr:longevity assurance proteins LAG1/LAC1 [Dendrothele bispora CBS 962.96]